MTRDHHVQAHRDTIVQFTQPGGPLSPESLFSTYSQHSTPLGYSRERLKLHRQILRDFFASSTPARDGKAIVMSGPPGVGKSAARKERIGTGERWRVIDPDYFKEQILAYESAQDPDLASLHQDPLLQERINNGEKFAPGEYAALIHEESSDLAQLAISRAVKNHENVVLDGVHGNASKLEKKLLLLRDAGYASSSTTVLVVDGTQQVTRARVEHRWRKGYERFLDDAASLDGRFVPESITAGLYASPEAKTSSCYKAATQVLTTEAGKSMIEQVDVYIVPRADASPQLYRTFTNNGIGTFKVTEHVTYTDLTTSVQRKTKTSQNMGGQQASSLSHVSTAPTAGGGDKVWVEEHQRNGTTVKGHFRTIRQRP